MLSILIPVYNFDCVALVKSLHDQCLKNNIEFEIVVLDDTSTHFKLENSEINKLSFASFLTSEIHYGRAKIRNELGRRARYENLLFIDADALVDNPYYIENYIRNINNAEVIIGGMKYSNNPPKDNALRWHYGSKREFLPAERRNETPYGSLISFNILIKKKVLEKVPFDEGSIDVEKSGYGHEDTLLGLELQKKRISVLHIDNQLVHNYNESNEGFLKNSLIAVEKYVFNPTFRKKEVVEKIKIFRVFEKVKSFRLVSVLSLNYILFAHIIKRKLCSKNPSLFLFDIYRLSYLAYYHKKSRS